MALLNCPECGHDVSSEASTCPNCGFPIQKNLNTTTNPDPLDEKWLEKYKKKPFKTKINLAIFNAVSLVLFIVFFTLLVEDKEKYVYFDGTVDYFDKTIWSMLTYLFFIILLFSFISFILSLFMVKTKIVNIDGYNVVAYCGFFKSSLIVENNVIDSFVSSSFHGNDVFAKLPNGKTILAKFSSGTASICEYK